MENQRRTTKQKRGSEVKPPERHHQIAPHEDNPKDEHDTGHERNKDEGKAAGRKTGLVARKKRVERTEHDGLDHLL